MGAENVKLFLREPLLFKNKKQLEKHLYERERSLFNFQETITLYDLTNTYFEGSGKFNVLAAHGRSKEKRSDCPLVTLGLVLNGSGSNTMKPWRLKKDRDCTVRVQKVINEKTGEVEF